MPTQFEATVTHFTKVLGFQLVAGKELKIHKLKETEMLLRTVGDVEKLIIKGDGSTYTEMCFNKLGKLISLSPRGL